MNEGLGSTTTDSSGNANTGTLVNSPTWTTGKIGNALNFGSGGATNQYVNVGTGTNLNLTGSLTIAAWIFPRTAGPAFYGRIIDKAGDYFTGYALMVAIFGSDSTANVLSVRFGNQNFFSNGNFAGSTFSVNPPSSSTNMLLIGNRPDLGAQFNGLIDEVGIWSRALTQTEISTLYNLGNGLTCP